MSKADKKRQHKATRAFAARQRTAVAQALDVRTLSRELGARRRAGGAVMADPVATIAKAGLDRADPARLRSETPLGWYLVMAAPGRELRAEASLMEAGFDVYLPRETRWKRPRREGMSTAGPRVEVVTPMLPGYLFVCAGQREVGVVDEVWTAQGPELAVAWSADGVERVLCCAGGRPWPVRAGLVALLREAEGAGAFDHTTRARKRYRAGQQVRIIVGLFQGHLAEVKAEADAAGVLPVFLPGPILKGSMSVDIDDVELA